MLTLPRSSPEPDKQLFSLALAGKLPLEAPKGQTHNSALEHGGGGCLGRVPHRGQLCRLHIIPSSHQLLRHHSLGCPVPPPALNNIDFTAN